MQLIKIKNIPAEYKFKIENAALVKAENSKKQHSSNCSDIKSKGNKSTSDKIDLNGSIKPSVIELNKPLLENKNGDNVNAKAVSEYMKIKNIIKEEVGTKVNNKKMDTIDDTFKLDDFNFENIAESIQSELDAGESELEYIPASFGVEVISKPKVEIVYIGGYNYVPPSSSPDYEESEE